MNDISIDASALVRIANDPDPMRHAVLATLDRLADEDVRFFLLPQALSEFYVVATRPFEVNGLGLTVSEADAQIEDFLQWSTLLPDPANSFRLWRRLVTESNTVGKRAHDAKLAASLSALGIRRLVTLNARDFARFNGVAGIDLELIVPAA